MTWADAFKKAIAATGWLLVFGIIFGVILVFGVGLGAFGAFAGSEGNIGSVVAGWILILLAYLGLAFGGLAILLKYISESVTETMMKRLYPPAASSQPQSPPRPAPPQQ